MTILEKACNLVKNVPQQKHRIVAIIVDKRNRILSIGQNDYQKTSPLQDKYARLAGMPQKQKIHAEISALSKIKNGKPYAIYVARTNNFGEMRMAKPCCICSKALADFGIQKIYYTE